MQIFRRVARVLGPGFITGASDDDPSGIGTYAQTGAQLGYTQLWTALFSFPFMAAIQEMCGRIGIVTGLGLGGVLRKHYSKPLLFSMVALLLLANTLNIGADLGAMAASMQLLVPIPFPILLILMTATTLCLQIFIPYVKYVKYLKYLTISLFAYFFIIFAVKLNWNLILLSTIFPSFSFSKDYVMNIVAILGTTISPYLFFWQPSEEVEEKVAKGIIRVMGKGAGKFSKKDIVIMRIDTVFGMFFSNLVMFFIFITAASTLHGNGITSITTAAQAASALRPVAGDFAFLLFTMGIIGTGFLAIPVLAGSASYAVCEALNWKRGLYNTFAEARAFYGVIAVSTLLGVTINFLKIEPFVLLYYTAVLNGLIAPILIFMILRITNNTTIMKKYTNSKLSNILGITILLLMTVCAGLVFYNWF